MPLRLVIFAEAPPDARAAAILVDRVLAELDGAEWVSDLLAVEELSANPEQWAARASVRTYGDGRAEWSLDGKMRFIDVHKLKDLAEELRRDDRSFRLTLGLFGGEPGKHAAKLGRKAIDVAEMLDRRSRGAGLPIDCAIIMQDMDGDASRRDGLHQARRSTSWRRFEVTVACPNQCHEAWILASFLTDDDTETRAIEAEAKSLGFDPRRQSERLHHDHGRVDSASAVLERIGASVDARSEMALRLTPLEHMRDRGQRNGLAEFLDEVGEYLVPRILSATR